jgi:hypothetical protein
MYPDCANISVRSRTKDTQFPLAEPERMARPARLAA